jgi:thimet oligopeptidase
MHTLYLINKVRLLSIVSCTFIAVISGCSLFKQETDQSNDILDNQTQINKTQINHVKNDDALSDIYKAECIQYINIAQEKFKSLKDNGKNMGDGEFIYTFDRLYFNVNNFLVKKKTLSQLHPSSNVTNAYSECVLQARRLLSFLLSSPVLYKRMLSIEINNKPDITLYKSKILKTFIFHGAHLSDNQKIQLDILKQDEYLLKNRFIFSVQEDIRTLSFRDSNKTKGLPQKYINRISRPERGIFEVSTHASDYYVFMSHNEEESLRKAIYLKRHQRGYPGNEDVLEDLLRVREKIARLLGFDNYAAYSATNQMALTTTNINNFLSDVEQYLKPKLKKDIDFLVKKQARLSIESKELNEWNYRYLKTHLLENSRFNQEALRAYFPIENVISTILTIMENTYNLSFNKIDLKTWHPTVKSFQVSQNKKPIAIIHLDLITRDLKYKNNAVMPINLGLKDDSLSETVLVTNFKKGDSTDIYLEVIQVEQLFHQFGHLIHAIFSGKQLYGLFSGLTLESDFIEVPALLNEELFWQWPIFKKIAINSQQKIMPYSWYSSIKRNRQRFKAIDLQRQICLARLLLKLHQKDTRSLNIYKTEQRIFNQHSPFSTNSQTRFYANLEQLVLYSSNYYSYLWSQAIAEDILSYFGKTGFQNPTLMQAYISKILAQAGRKPAHQLIEDFLSRPYDLKAYLKALN